MKTTELMVGDWVMGSLGDRGRVVAIDDEDNYKTHHGSVRIKYSEDFAANGEWVDKISHIPLTAEILEKNGFEMGYKAPEGVYSLYVDGTIVVEVALYAPFFINISYEEITPDGTDSGTISTFCKVHGEEIYVHDLQNFLRLHNIDIDLVL